MIVKGFAIKWKTFESQLTSNVKGHLTRDEHTDVTLVSDDQIPFSAHKCIVSACSPVLKNILLNDPHPHPLIYMRGVTKVQLETLLEFMYQGKVEVQERNIKKFFELTEELELHRVEIDSINSISVDNRTSETDLDMVKKDAKKLGPLYQKEVNSQEKKMSELAKNFVDANIDMPTSDNEGTHFGTNLFKCDYCDATFVKSKSKVRHQESKHMGIRYPCKHCDYQATQKAMLKIHENSVHGGMKFSCEICKKQFSHKNNLTAHKKITHEGRVYMCSECDYTTSYRSMLKTHEEFTHKGIGYSCDQCPQVFKDKGHFRAHQRSVHEGEKYPCNQCGFHSSRRDNLKDHMRAKHGNI